MQGNIANSKCWYAQETSPIIQKSLASYATFLKNLVVLLKESILLDYFLVSNSLCILAYAFSLSFLEWHRMLCIGIHVVVWCALIKTYLGLSYSFVARIIWFSFLLSRHLDFIKYTRLAAFLFDSYNKSNKPAFCSGNETRGRTKKMQITRLCRILHNYVNFVHSIHCYTVLTGQPSAVSQAWPLFHIESGNVKSQNISGLACETRVAAHLHPLLSGLRVQFLKQQVINVLHHSKNHSSWSLQIWLSICNS